MGLWYGKDWDKYQHACEQIRRMLSENVVLHHPDYAAGADPAVSWRSSEISVGARDYCWTVVLCQREEPHGPPEGDQCCDKEKMINVVKRRERQCGQKGESVIVIKMDRASLW